jgi:hypothetical protein
MGGVALGEETEVLWEALYVVRRKRTTWKLDVDGVTLKGTLNKYDNQGRFGLFWLRMLKTGGLLLSLQLS